MFKLVCGIITLSLLAGQAQAFDKSTKAFLDNLTPITKVCLEDANGFAEKAQCWSVEYSRQSTVLVSVDNRLMATLDAEGRSTFRKDYQRWHDVSTGYCVMNTEHAKSVDETAFILNACMTYLTSKRIEKVKDLLGSR